MTMILPLATSPLDAWGAMIPGAIAALLILVLIRVFSSPTFKGWFGENQVRKGLQKLDPLVYRIFHDLYLPRPDGDGTTQIDHLVISPYGVFVIETKNYRGWIFGSPKQAQWTQQLHRNKHRFQNPLHQNDLHIRALAEFLGLPKDRFHSVIFFIGDSTFKTPMPENVLNQGLTSYMLSHKTLMLTPPEQQSAEDALKRLADSTDHKKVAKEHVAAIEHRTQRRRKKIG